MLIHERERAHTPNIPRQWRWVCRTCSPTPTPRAALSCLALSVLPFWLLCRVQLCRALRCLLPSWRTALPPSAAFEREALSCPVLSAALLAGFRVAPCGLFALSVAACPLAAACYPRSPSPPLPSLSFASVTLSRTCYPLSPSPLSCCAMSCCRLIPSVVQGAAAWRAQLGCASGCVGGWWVCVCGRG